MVNTAYLVHLAHPTSSSVPQQRTTYQVSRMACALRGLLVTKSLRQLGVREIIMCVEALTP